MEVMEFHCGIILYRFFFSNNPYIKLSSEYMATLYTFTRDTNWRTQNVQPITIILTSDGILDHGNGRLGISLWNFGGNPDSCIYVKGYKLVHAKCAALIVTLVRVLQ